MKKERKHSVDKLFLESLAGHQIEPSAGIWGSLSSHIPSAGGRGIFLYLVSGILIGTFTFLMHSTLDPGSSMQAEIKDQAEDIEVPLIIENTHTAVTGSNGSDKTAEETDLPDDNAIAITPSATAENSTPISAPEQAATTIINNAAEIESDLSHEDFDRDFTSSHVYLDKASLISTPIEISSNAKDKELQDRESPEPIFDLNIKDSYAKKADVLFGAAFSPAVNIYPEGQNRNDYSLEFLTSYEKSRFILEGGIGANYTSESAKYQINYSSYDSVGYYVGVTSFTVDPVNPDSVVFETNLKNLYDSIDHYSINENTNKFVYLQIPLRIGYRIFERNRFSLDIKLGILFSLQVYKDIPGVPYQGSDVNQIEVIRQYPDRLTTTWQYTAGIGMNYHINNNLRFTLEPIYRQYIKSVYSPSSEFPAKSPYSFGIRGGIYFHF